MCHWSKCPLVRKQTSLWHIMAKLSTLLTQRASISVQKPAHEIWYLCQRRAEKPRTSHAHVRQNFLCSQTHVKEVGRVGPNLHIWSWISVHPRYNKRLQWNFLSPPVKYFYWPFLGGTSFMDHLCYLCLVFVMLSRLFSAALWSPAGKGLTSCFCLWCLIVFLSLSHMVFWVWCGTWLYRFLIFAAFLTLTVMRKVV